ncbi:hypothetical protein ES703_93246 [subsurface metagenome]
MLPYPAMSCISLDRRFILSETAEQALAQIEAILKDIEQGDPSFQGSTRIRELEEVSYTGMKKLAQKIMFPWLTATDHPKVTQACTALAELGQKPEFSYWSFGTDGSHTAVVLGIPTIGYGPGQEELAHTAQERISLDSLVQSVAGNAAIALTITE